MSWSQKTRETEALNRRISELKQERDRIDAEARAYADKRDELNNQFKHLRSEIAELRDQRDKLNEEVKDLKLLRSELKEKTRGKIEEIKKLKKQSKELAEKKPPRSHQSLQNEVESIDWKIQTTQMSLNEEKELVGQVKQLETQLNVHRKLERTNQKIHDLQAEIKATKDNERRFHEKLTETARKSQGIHEKMLGKVEDSKKLKEEADCQHQLFLESRTRVKPFEQEIYELVSRLRQQRLEKLAEEEREKEESEKALREKLGGAAREKLKRGEKLTWEEFQLLDDNDD